MDRRDFLIKGTAALMGALLGIKGGPAALACGIEARGQGFAPRIALIVDDIGFSLSRARRFLDLDAPLTYSILPRVTYSQTLALEIHEAGHQIMLHQPMEPYDRAVDPGPGALFVGDGTKRIERVMEENILEIPFATGVNNHMGSRFTSREMEMRKALTIVKNKDLFFVDSLTSSHSRALETARRLHLAAARRNIFLDVHPQECAVLSQLRQLTRIARLHGTAIGIGHPYPSTAQAIGRFIRNLKGITLVHISALISDAVPPGGPSPQTGPA